MSGSVLPDWAVAGGLTIPGSPMPQNQGLPGWAAAAGLVSPSAMKLRPSASKIVAVDPTTGVPVYENPEDNRAQAEAMGYEAKGSGQKALEGATFGMAPFAEAVVGSMATGKPYRQSLQDVRDFSKQYEADNPAGAALANIAGSLAPTTAILNAAKPVVALAGQALPKLGLGEKLANTLVNAGIGAGSSAGSDLGSGETGNIGRDTARGAEIGAVLPAVAGTIGKIASVPINMAKGLIAAGKTVFSDAGQSALAGKALLEPTGGKPVASFAEPGLEGLTYRTAQAAEPGGSPPLAAFDRRVATAKGLDAPDPGDRLQANGTTPNQISALARALVGDRAGAVPEILAGETSASGTKALVGAHDSVKAGVDAKWANPVLTEPVLSGAGIATGVGNDVSKFPAAWRDQITGEKPPLGSHISSLNELPAQSSVADVNSIRSQVLDDARTAAEGYPPDRVRAAAGNKLAASILGRLENDPGIAGRAEGTVLTAHELRPDPNPPDVSMSPPVNIGRSPIVTANPTASEIPNQQFGGPRRVNIPIGGGKPTAIDMTSANTPAPVTGDGPPVAIGFDRQAAVPARPDILEAYKNALDATRVKEKTFGYDHLQQPFRKNYQGNIEADPREAFNNHFDFSNGSPTGLEHLQDVSNLTRTYSPEAADALEAAARAHANAGILNHAAGNGTDALGNPKIDPVTLETTLSKFLDGQAKVPMMEPSAGNLTDVRDAASILNRGARRAGGGSPTFDNLVNNKLVDSVLGQVGASAIGAGVGGYGGYLAPGLLPHPDGAEPSIGSRLASALMGAGAGAAAARIPGATALPQMAARAFHLDEPRTAAIIAKIQAGLADPAEYARLVNTPMPQAPGLFDQTAASKYLPLGARLAVPYMAQPNRAETR